MNNPTSRLFAFHLLNDRSGSPKVLSQLLKIWTSSGAKNIHLYTSPHQNGFLSDIQGIQYHWGGINLNKTLGCGCCIIH
ncbi:MAG: hypothetical protein IPL35_12910 [Sphingobacteriales bacterium]|nr:hypothetical protein [Sphingobacteriales bacterium]